MGKVIAIVLGVVGLLVILTCAGVIGLGVLGVRQFEAMGGYTVAAVAPSTVRVGEPFEVVLTMTNQQEVDRVIGDVEWLDDFLETVEIVSISPQPVDGAFLEGWTSHNFAQVTTVPALGSGSVTYTLVATEPGFRSTWISVYADDATFYFEEALLSYEAVE